MALKIFKALDEGGIKALWEDIVTEIGTAVTQVKNWVTQNYVAKESGKGLSSNDYTTDEKNKLAGIEAGAQVNVQPNWDATSGMSSIAGRPTINTSITADKGNKDIPTVEAVRAYVDAAVAGASNNLGTVAQLSGLTTTCKKGDFYRAAAAWGSVHVGDIIIAEKNNPSQSIDGTNWSLLHNEMDTDTTYTFEGGTNGFTVTPSGGSAQTVGVSVTAVNGHSVNSDVPANAVFTDTHTTKAGHYDPSAEDGSKINPNETSTYIRDNTRDISFIGAIARDSKGHATGGDTYAVQAMTDDEIHAAVAAAIAEIANS